MSALAATDPLVEVQKELAEFVHDPLGFVRCAYAWGEGELAGETGPRAHQVRFLKQLGDHLQNPATRHKPFRKAVSSGHGIGKSAELSWIVNWALSTFEDTKVIIMAGTGDQLKTKTQPEVAKWFRLGVNSELFEVNVTSIKVKELGHEQTWRADFATWSEENPQASAGAHNKGKRLVIIYDEASGIPDIIWKTQEGALTDADTEIIWIAFSQATKNCGYFYECVFGNQRHRWRPEVIDSREVEGTNTEEINETIALYGEDSDHVRVRYRGLFPTAGGAQFIDQKLINDAQRREARSLPDDPLVVGVDFAWGGGDDNVARARRGMDAKSYPPIKVKGEFTRDPAVMTNKLAVLLEDGYPVGNRREPIDMMFLDSAGIAGPIAARLRELGFKNIQEVNFGADSPDPKYAYFRDYMWGKAKEALQAGLAIDSDPELAADLAKPITISDRLNRIKLEPKDLMKKRLAKTGGDASSPDDGDALALTYSRPVKAKPQVKKKNQFRYPGQGAQGWMG
jgi:hypothetical protein